MIKIKKWERSHDLSHPVCFITFHHKQVINESYHFIRISQYRLQQHIQIYS